ncbi:T9SS type A sorting domain-containing protein [Aquimarina megaterium]|uniref:T9SS type A sorting domain-containing protein n=1 Tax=Aquimarina megaterium TaxID=1443666 RepID=UPI0004717962|nr:T9SS type A sorting domain-containing protein [Aquimarina megaterium]
MKTNKLLFTFLFACISFMGMSKNNDSLIKIEAEDNRLDMHCAAYIPQISGPGLLCLNNKYTFTWLHTGPNWANFLEYEWELLDKHNTPLKRGTNKYSYATLYLDNYAVTQIRVRSIHGVKNDPANYCKGYWTTLPIEIIRGATPITEVTSIGSFCKSNNVAFTILHHSIKNDKPYKWEIHFGGVPIPIVGTSNGIQPFLVTVPNNYFGIDPIQVFVTPVNSICGDGPTYNKVITPAPPFTPLVKGIIKPVKYCSGKSNTFRVSNPMPGTEYKWTIERYYSFGPQPGLLTKEMGFEMNEITPDFGSGNPSSAGTVVKYRIKLQGRSGCNPWSAPVSTGMVYVSYSNCNPIGSISSLSGGQGKSQADLFDMNIYPNPSSSGVFNINTLGLEGTKKIQVYDISGKYIIEKTLEANQSKLDLSTYSRGLYFVKISNGVDQKTQKIIF